MGKLTLTTLSDGTVSTDINNPIRGSAKAWIFLDGTVSPPSVFSSYNISSVIKNGTGQYRVAFINNFSDTKYAILVCAARGSPARWGGTGDYYFARTISQAQLLCTDYTSSDPDSAYLSAVFFR